MTDPLDPQAGSPAYADPTTPVPTTGTVAGSAANASVEAPGSSTTEVAKSEGRRVASDVAEGGKHVARVAADEASSVAGEAKHQARSLLDQAGSELSTHAATQKDTLVSWLRDLADELRSMAASTSGSQGPGVATGLVDRGADLAQQTASWLGDREPRAVLDEVGSFARRRPGTFLLIAAGAGIIVGRLTRGLAAEADHGGNQSEQRRLVTPDIPVGSTYTTADGTVAADSWAGGPAVEAQWSEPASSTTATSSKGATLYRQGEP